MHQKSIQVWMVRLQSCFISPAALGSKIALQQEGSSQGLEDLVESGVICGLGARWSP